MSLPGGFIGITIAQTLGFAGHSGGFAELADVPTSESGWNLVPLLDILAQSDQTIADIQAAFRSFGWPIPSPGDKIWRRFLPPLPTEAQFDYRYGVLRACAVSKCLPIPPYPPFNWGSMNLMQAEYVACTGTQSGCLPQKPKPKPPGPQEGRADRLLRLIGQIRKLGLWVQIGSCFQFAEPLYVVECLEALLFEKVLEVVIEGIIKSIIALLKLISKAQWKEVQKRGGIKKMACADTHNVTQKAQGAGLCCAALRASGQKPAIGVRVSATDRRGKCFVCEIGVSRSPKKPGVLVFRRGHACAGGVCLCATSTGGCCALAAAS